MAGGFIAVTGRWKSIGSVQSENLHNLEIALCILRILRLCSNLEIAQHVHNLRTLNFAWQWVIYCVACKMKDILDTGVWRLPSLATYCDLSNSFWDVLCQAIRSTCSSCVTAWYLTGVQLYLFMLLGIHLHIMCLTEHVENGEAWLRQCRAVLCLSPSWVSEWSKLLRC